MSDDCSQQRPTKAVTATGTDARSCLFCKLAKCDAIGLDCGKHFLCKECLKKNAIKNASRMYECRICTTAPVPVASVPVFVDHDNLLLEAQKLGAKQFGQEVTKDHRIRIDYRNLGNVIAKGRKLEGNVYNCHTMRINDNRFSLVQLENSSCTGMQKEVDTTISVDIMDKIPISSTVALVSGDILPALKKALMGGCRVEIYMWEHNTAKCLKEFAKENDNCVFVPLNEHFEDIICRSYFTYEEDSSSIVLTVTRGEFEKDERVYKTHEKWWTELEQVSKWPVQYKWLTESRHLLLVFKGLKTTALTALIKNISSIDKDDFGMPHEGRCALYANFKLKLERGQSRSVTPGEGWSEVASRRSSRRSSRLSTPPSIRDCCSGKNCEEGSKCSYHHSINDRHYFTLRKGKGHPFRKTRLCPQYPCQHKNDPAKCDFAHGPSDGWCTKCHKKGHFKATCRNSECKDPKHTARQALLALTEIDRV